MRKPSLKSWAIFAAGFISCLGCLAVMLGYIFYRVTIPMSDAEEKEAARHTTPDSYLFLPPPAVFDFTAIGKNAKPLDLREYRGHVVVLNVCATWCHPCMAELASLGKLASHYADAEDVAVVCLSEEPTETVFRNSRVITSGVPVYSLNGNPLPSVYKTDGIPATFIIDKHGLIICQHVGSVDWSHPSVIMFIDSLR